MYRQQARARYWARAAAGQCVTCGNPVETAGFKRCGSCRARRRQQQRRARGGQKTRPDYRQRRAQGLCVTCGVKPAVPPALRCQRCHKEKTKAMRAQARRRYWECRRQGICITCHQRPASPGYARCIPCLDRHRHEARVRHQLRQATERAAQRRATKSQEARERYWRRVAQGCCPRCGQRRAPSDAHRLCGACRYDRRVVQQGRRHPDLCGRCGSRPRLPGASRCQRCIDQQREHEARCRAEGRCPECGEPLPSAPEFRRYQRCPDCRARGRQQEAARRAALSAQGRCTRCGGAPPAPGFSWCQRCRERNRVQKAAGAR